MIAVLMVHVAVAAAVGALARSMGPRVFWVGAIAPASTLVWVGLHGGDVLDGEPVTQRIGWVSQLALDLSFRVDAFALVMLGIVAGIGVLVMIYASQYFGPRAGLGRFGALLVAFTGAMTGLVVADDLLLIFVFWELTSVTSYGLIGIDDEKASARSAAAQALLITGVGGLALLAGLVLVSLSTGATSLSELATADVGGSVASWGAALVLVGCFTKSAQVPFHGWLPGAMAAPTPVSAYLHSATMVKAGVFLVARLSPSLAELAPWRPMAIGFGLATMVWGGYRSLRQVDLKLLLAYGTVSQLGMLIAVFGTGEPKLALAGTGLLVGHALFKACLFMVVGIIDHSAHTRILGELSGLARAMPVVFAASVVAGASMAGVIPLLGFLGKEAALVGMLDSDIGLIGLALGVFVVSSGITAAYTLRFLWEGFRTKPGLETSLHPPGPVFVAPAVLLAVLTVVLGIAVALTNEVVRPAAIAVDPGAEKYELVLWEGFTTAFILSLAALALGGVLFAVSERVETFQHRVGRGWDASVAFSELVRRSLVGAARVTRVVQPGSLPLYLGVIALGVVVLPGLVVIRNTRVPDDLVFAESALQVIVVVLAAAAAAGVAITQRRFPAVLLLGVVGFGSAALFVIQGAPDLALTQVLVETVVVAVFLLVLRHLPERFPRGARVEGATVLRVGVAAVVGAVVFLVMLTASADRTAEPVDAELIARSYPEGDGANVVNVTLVDFRGLDTLGEGLVLAVAALGVIALVRAGRRPKAHVDA